MARIISCPSCARRLSVNQALAAEKTFKCPACHAVFALPADDGCGLWFSRERDEERDVVERVAVGVDTDAVHRIGMEGGAGGERI